MTDKIDDEIIQALCQNCRMSSRQLARKLDIHPATLISRIGRLEKSGVIKGYGAKLDLSALGYVFLGIVQVKIAKGKLIDTQEKISRVRGVVAVYDVTGEYDSVAIIAAKSREKFSDLIKSFSQIPFVEHTNTQVILNIVKESHDFEAV